MANNAPKTIRRYNKSMKLLVGGIIKSQIPVTRKLLKDLRQEMIRVIDRNARFSQGGKDGLGEGLKISPERKGKNGFIMDLKSTSPHASVQEFGITDMYVDANKYDRLKKWADHIAYQYTPGKNGELWVHIGGNKGRIELNNSKNKYFFSTVNRFIDGGKLTRDAQEAIIEELNRLF